VNEELLTPDELDRLSLTEQANYGEADHDGKVALTKTHRYALSQNRESMLRKVGTGAVVLGGLTTLLLSGQDYDNRHADTLPIAFLWLGIGVMSLGFWAFMFGIIEDRLLEIHAALKDGRE
jgi:hypothetical protein